MINQIPVWVNLVFLLAWFYAILMFHISNGKPKLITLMIVVWSIIHSVLAWQGFYENTTAMPPRFGLILIPIIVLIIFSLLPNQRALIFDNRNIKLSTFLHALRIPVEIVLLQLFIAGMVPELMTFEGRNFDILAGVSAPIIGFLFLKGKLSKTGLLIWNILGLILISFILVNGLLSAELPIQLFGFEQPNRAVMYFPFILLPATIVPIVLWTHLTDILKLRNESKQQA